MMNLQVEALITIPDQAIRLLFTRKIEARDFIVWLLMSYYHQTTDYSRNEIAWDEWTMIQSLLNINEQILFVILCSLHKHNLVRMPNNSAEWNRSVPIHPVAERSTTDHTLSLFNENDYEDRH